MCLQNGSPKSMFVASCEHGVEAEKNVSYAFHIHKRREEAGFGKRGKEAVHTSGAQGSAVRAKRLGAYCWASCLSCPTCGRLGGAESTEPRMTLQGPESTEPRMMLQGQADCWTPGTLQARSGAPHLLFASQGWPRAESPARPGRGAGPPQPLVPTQLLSWGKYGPIGPPAASLLSPTWAESPCRPGPCEGCSMGSDDPLGWAWEACPLLLESSAPASASPLSRGSWDTPQGACGFGPQPHPAGPSKAQERSAGGVPTP